MLTSMKKLMYSTNPSPAKRIMSLPYVAVDDLSSENYLSGDATAAYEQAAQLFISNNIESGNSIYEWI